MYYTADAISIQSVALSLFATVSRPPKLFLTWGSWCINYVLFGLYHTSTVTFKGCQMLSTKTRQHVNSRKREREIGLGRAPGTGTRGVMHWQPTISNKLAPKPNPIRTLTLN